MQHKGTKNLISTRLVLRPFTLSDAPSMFNNWTSDPLVTKFLRWTPHKNIETTKSVLNSWIDKYKDPKFYQWAIVLKEINEPIGSISVVKMDEEKSLLHVGYCIGSNWWHKGYTSEALKTVIDFLFNSVNAQIVESQHDPNNINSGKVMQKCGMRYDKTLKNADYNNQGVVDAVIYSILKKDY